MITKEIPVAVRNTFGKGSMRQLRMVGKTPGIVYKGGADALPLEFETKVLFQELLNLQGRSAVITLKIDNGTEKNVVVKEVQTDPVKDTLCHVDFLEIDIDKPAEFMVSINFTGRAKGVDLGGFLDIVKAGVVLEGLPLSIPDECVVDVSALDIGEKITVGSITIPKGVTLVTPPDTVCVAVTTLAAPEVEESSESTEKTDETEEGSASKEDEAEPASTE